MYTEYDQSMFAIVKSSGKQYRVEPGMVVEIEKVEGDLGANIEIKSVLLVCDNGAMLNANNAVVTCQVVRHFRGEKVIAFRKQRRTSNFTKKRGHRQDMTALFIKDIKVN